MNFLNCFHKVGQGSGAMSSGEGAVGEPHQEAQ